jgi:hypothetical protein
MHKTLIRAAILLSVSLFGCVVKQPVIEEDFNQFLAVPDKHKIVELPDLGPAPELQNQVWLNTHKPLRLSELRGKVVLLEFWTFG